MLLLRWVGAVLVSSSFALAGCSSASSGTTAGSSSAGAGGRDAGGSGGDGSSGGAGTSGGTSFGGGAGTGAGGGASGGTTGGSGSAGAGGASSSTAGNGGAPDLGACVATFGSALTATHGRIDGTLIAIVRPQDQMCPMPNSHHLILEIRMGSDDYRLLINVDSTLGTDPRVQFAELDHPLLGEPFAEGWHTAAASLDYVGDLGLHSAQFTPMQPGDLVDAIVSELTLGAPISVYTLGFGTGGHHIHRDHGGDDGAVFLHPTTAPHALVFHFATQSF